MVMNRLPADFRMTVENRDNVNTPLGTRSANLYRVFSPRIHKSTPPTTTTYSLNTKP